MELTFGGVMYRGVEKDEGDRLQAPFVGRAMDSALSDYARHPDESRRLTRVGIISNPRSHLNKRRERSLTVDEGIVFKRRPVSPADLRDALALFASENIDLLVIDGGDGTVRDVLSAAPDIFTKGLPRMAVLPSGKTNALAIDLKMPHDATLTDLIEANRGDKVKFRPALEILRDGATRPFQRGFIFGSGAYVRATELAQRVHRFGWFNGVAIGLSLVWALVQTFFGAKGNPWRTGEHVKYVKPDNSLASSDLYMLLGSTLKRLPLGLKPLGPTRGGLKFLAVKAPPQNMLTTVPRLLRGEASQEMREAGYLHTDTSVLRVSFQRSFILDGERFPGGTLFIRESEPMEFVVP